MRARFHAVLGAVVGLTVLWAGSGPAPLYAYPIPTASLDEVAAQATHVALGTWDPHARRLRVERWLRGTWAQPQVDLHGLPTLEVFAPPPLRGIPVGRSRPSNAPEVTEQEARAPRLLLFLEENAGRLHVCGHRRYGGGVWPHSSVRWITAGGVSAWHQIMNPGGVVRVRDQAADEPRLLAKAEGVLAAHPYRPAPVVRAALPPGQQGGFLAIVDEVLDWYQGDWPAAVPGYSAQVPSDEAVSAAAERLVAWVEAAPAPARVHGLDALCLLLRKVQGRLWERPGVEALALRAARSTPPADVSEWLLAELQHGDSYADRAALARLARALNRTLYAQALARLEAWVEQTEVDVGTASWWALVELGEKPRAEDAVQRRRRREASEGGQGPK